MKKILCKYFPPIVCRLVFDYILDDIIKDYLESQNVCIGKYPSKSCDISFSYRIYINYVIVAFVDGDVSLGRILNVIFGINSVALDLMRDASDSIYELPLYDILK